MEVDAILFHLSGDQTSEQPGAFFAVVIIDISASLLQLLSSLILTEVFINQNCTTLLRSTIKVGSGVC